MTVAQGWLDAKASLRQCMQMRRNRNNDQTSAERPSRRPRWCCLGGYALAAGSALRGAGPLLPLSQLAGLADCLQPEDLAPEEQPFGLTAGKLSPIKV